MFLIYVGLAIRSCVTLFASKNNVVASKTIEQEKEDANISKEETFNLKYEAKKIMEENHNIFYRNTSSVDYDPFSNDINKYINNSNRLVEISNRVDISNVENYYLDRGQYEPIKNSISKMFSDYFRFSVLLLIENKLTCDFNSFELKDVYDLINDNLIKIKNSELYKSIENEETGVLLCEIEDKLTLLKEKIDCVAQEEQIIKEKEEKELEEKHRIELEQRKKELEEKHRIELERQQEQKEKEKRLRETGIYEVDKMDGIEFEKWCAYLLTSLGYKNVSITQGSGDQGVDLFAEKDDISYAIQCKRWNEPLSNKPVQEVFAGKQYYHKEIPVVMTTNYFTNGAKTLAKNTKVKLWDRDKLIEMIEESKKASKIE